MALSVAAVIGTRPEGIKMAPLVRLLGEDPRFRVRVLLTAQHRDLADDVVRVFGLRVDADLDAMRPAQGPLDLLTRVLTGLPPLLAADRPDVVLVQGDTTTTLAAALAAFHEGLPVAHVEAGLRTHDAARPFPEEANRRLVAGLASLHFAPCEGARQNLLREGVREDAVFVTGQTGIDALRAIAPAASPNPPYLAQRLAAPGRRLILATAHRRESFGAALDGILAALAELARRPDVEVVMPVHPNPEVGRRVAARLAGEPRVLLLPPVDYPTMLFLLGRSHLVISDSGGLQEEAPALGRPLLVLREVTERPEVVEAGAAVLVGTDPARRILAEAGRLLDDDAAHARASRVCLPYGGGDAARRIRDVLLAWKRP